ncbi:MAG: electron transfer flavoprotein beta subunit/FixA family protein [Ignavibacteriales bacterium]|nr:electron transfer flavoprotein beta subunit/FixA family protein [Ignavibacteriales bacterium]
MYRSIVMVKQVPDTANISGKVMRDDGTVNRSKLPAIFNNEDVCALELALQVKERYGGTVAVVTMGPPRAADVLRECLFLGADEAYLVTDRKFAGADTLATSYVLSAAIKKIGEFDFVFAGRQAIDGDTAQVGPQTAEKLGVPQITYAEEILEVADGRAKVRKKIDGGDEVVEASLPVLLTALKDAVEPRPFSVKRVMKYKGAKALPELEKLTEENSLLYIDKLEHEYRERKLFIPTFTADDLDVDPKRCGLHGSPTKVHKVESVVLAGGDPERFEPTKEGLGALVDKLMDDHILG